MQATTTTETVPEIGGDTVMEDANYLPISARPSGEKNCLTGMDIAHVLTLNGLQFGR